MECCSATDRADVIIKFVEEDMIKEIYLLNELLKIHVREIRIFKFKVEGGGWENTANVNLGLFCF